MILESLILQGALAFLAGVFTWTFCEYALHNWLGHVHKRNAFSRQHMAHHANTDWFAPSIVKAAVGVPITVAVFLLAMLAVGGVLAGAYTLGFALFYVMYEVVHRRTHTHAPIGFYGRWARKHHLHHHFCNPKSNHGVTTPIWDIVFRTYDRPTVVPIPQKQEKGVTWLLDSVTGELRERYARDYRLCRRRAVAA